MSSWQYAHSTDGRIGQHQNTAPHPATVSKPSHCLDDEPIYNTAALVVVLLINKTNRAGS